MSWTYEECIARGMRPAEAETWIRQRDCKHDFGDRCEQGFNGCFRTCLKCRAMIGLGGYCWELKEKREAAAKAGNGDKERGR